MPEKPPQNLENIGEPKTPESELSPEVLEKVMAKVQDVNEKNTAVHSIRQHKVANKKEFTARLDDLKKILQEGLLGQPYREKDTITKKEWAEYARKRGDAFVFFNKVGYDIDKLEDSDWIAGQHENPLAIIFNVEQFKSNEESEADYTRNTEPFKTKTYGINSEGRIIYKADPEPSDRKRTVVPFPEMGYALTFRVAPRFFKGIVLRADRERTDEELAKIKSKNREKRLHENIERGLSADEASRYYKTTSQFYDADISDLRKRYKYIEQADEEAIQKRVGDIVSIMRNANPENEKLFLPIYDIRGNLWWPKKMSHEEVKKFVEERDKNKKEK